MKRFSKLSILTLCIAFSSVAVAAVARKGPAVTKQIQETIAQVRSGKTVDAKSKAAEHLERLVRNMKSKDVSEPLVGNIASLLNYRDVLVRYYVVLALEDLGPAAKSAAPKLLKILPDEDCANGPITVGDAIRDTLSRMGIKPPPPPDCVRISG